MFVTDCLVTPAMKPLKLKAAIKASPTKTSPDLAQSYLHLNPLLRQMTPILSTIEWFHLRKKLNNFDICILPIMSKLRHSMNRLRRVRWILPKITWTVIKTAINIIALILRWTWYPERRPQQKSQICQSLELLEIWKLRTTLMVWSQIWSTKIMMTVEFSIRDNIIMLVFKN